MSEIAPYGVSYIASAPEELKVGDRVELDNGEKGNVTTFYGNDKVYVLFDNEMYNGRYAIDRLRKLPDTILFEEKQAEPWNVAMFRKIASEMADTYARKNTTYNDSFGKSVGKYGFIAALTRMSDKFNRIENLILGAENKVPDESLEDSLLDLACYSVMTIVALRDAKIGDVDFENVV